MPPQDSQPQPQPPQMPAPLMSLVQTTPQQNVPVSETMDKASRYASWLFAIYVSGAIAYIAFTSWQWTQESPGIEEALAFPALIAVTLGLFVGIPTIGFILLRVFVLKTRSKTPPS